MIGSGVQILSESFLIENFSKTSKEKLFKILRENEISNVALISGDVHTSQLYENDCSSHTG